jgi:pyruvate dehydrogenase (quinone)
MAKTVADILVERLIEWGVDTIFGLPGDGVNGIFEALRTHQKKITFVQVRHEEAAAFAAVGYAKFTGRLGVCIATSGPGGIHLLNGLYDAKCDGQPVLAITGHTFHDQIGTYYQQDVDLDKIFTDVAVYNQRVMGPSHVVNVVDEAIKTAMMRRGVSHINIPKDVQDWTHSDTERSETNIPKHSANIYAQAYPQPHADLLQAAADIINTGEKVAILVGQGALNARAEVLQLAERAGAPVIKALLGKAVVPDDSEYTTGGIGLLGTAPSADALKDCDTLVILGSSFPYLEFYPKPGSAKIVQVDLDSARIGLRTPADIGLVGGCRDVLLSLLPLITHKEDRKFLETAQENMAHWRELMTTRGTREDMPMKPQVVVHELSKLLANDAIVISDTGTNTIWAARHLEMRGDMSFSVSGTLASMACAVPYAIGAGAAHPERQIVCVVGDGGFTMLMGELATLVKYKIPAKIIVINNSSLGMIKWEQMVMEGNPQYGIELQPIDFAMFARSCGAGGYRVEDPKNMAPVLKEAFAHEGPVVIDAIVDPLEPPLPGNISVSQTVNFAKAILRGEKHGWDIIKTVVKDKVREVI